MTKTKLSLKKHVLFVRISVKYKKVSNSNKSVEIATHIFTVLKGNYEHNVWKIVLPKTKVIEERR